MKSIHKERERIHDYEEKYYKDKKEVLHVHRKNTLLCLMVFIGITLGSFFFKNTASDPTLNIAMLYTLGIFMVTRYTESYVFGIIFSFASVMSMNFFFTYPYHSFNFSIKGYQVTFLGMFLIAIFTSAMSSNMKKQQKILAEQEKQLMEAQKEKMRVNLLRAISHDLRTPLTGIIGNSSSYLEMENELSAEEKRELVEYIENDANWLLNMVENLLSVTRIDNETARVTKSLESVDDVVSAAVTRFRKRFPEAKVVVKISDEPIMTEMDAMLIQQVILNILQNAELHAQSKKPLEFSVDTDEEYVNFHIRDYGIGIDAHCLNSIFDGDGYREEVTKTDGYKGMGIGLSICKTIVLAHEGKIVAMNHEDGAEFCFSLPAEREDKNVSEDFDIDY